MNPDQRRFLASFKERKMARTYATNTCALLPEIISLYTYVPVDPANAPPTVSPGAPGRIAVAGIY
jgi:hypothetical protein